MAVVTHTITHVDGTVYQAADVETKRDKDDNITHFRWKDKDGQQFELVSSFIKTVEEV